jgi:hypothetical protein
MNVARINDSQFPSLQYSLRLRPAVSGHAPRIRLEIYFWDDRLCDRGQACICTARVSLCSFMDVIGTSDSFFLCAKFLSSQAGPERAYLVLFLCLQRRLDACSPTSANFPQARHCFSQGFRMVCGTRAHKGTPRSSHIGGVMSVSVSLRLYVFGGSNKMVRALPSEWICDQAR